MNFEHLNLHPGIMAGVHELGFTELTPIQNQAIPPALEGKDIIGLAQTGTGKTAAFVIPLLQRLMTTPGNSLRAAIITPTRELAEQINSFINKFGRHTGINSAAIYGGVNMNQQILETGKNTQIIVACPGRLLDHLWRGTIDLSNLEILVLDEADRMLDMGFLPDIRKITDCLLQKHQTLLFSATMAENIRKLTGALVTNPVTIKIGQTAPTSTVDHSFYPIEQHLKAKLLTTLLNKGDLQSVLVFTRTKHRTDNIARQLKRSGFKAAPLHGDLSQNRRQATLDDFRKGKIKILVATDIAARGIDILHISHVINYDMPENTDAYIHRIGRTGRVNMNGDALTFVTGTDTAMVNSIEQILKKKIASRTLDNFDYSIPSPKYSGRGRNQKPVSQQRNRKRATLAV